MTLFLKQSTSFTFRIGPFVDATDGVTAETGLTLSQADFRLSKAGGAFAQKNESTSGSHDENGYYTCILNTTDTNTLGTLRIHVNESGALPVWVDCMVMPANVWDSLFGADKLQVHVDEMTAGIITAAVIATDAIDNDAIAANAITEIQNGLATEAALTTVDTVVDAIKAKTDNLPSDPADASVIAGRFDTLDTNLATVDTVVDAIKVKTDNLPSDPADASVIAGRFDTLDTSISNVSTAVGTVDTVVDAIKLKTDNLPSDPADASVIAGRFDTIDTSLTTIDDFLDTEVAGIKAKTDNLPSDPADQSLLIAATDAIMAAIAALVIPTAAENADELLNTADGIETTWSVKDVMRAMAAVLLGKLSGAGTTTEIFRAVTDAKDRVTATVDEDGNRSVVTIDVT